MFMQVERGATATPAQAAEIDALAAAVEAVNPTPAPLASPLLNGQSATPPVSQGAPGSD